MIDFDTSVRLNIYSVIAETARVPTCTEVAQSLKCQPIEVERAFERLRQKRLLILEPGSTSKIRMAPPFSAIETTFLVKVGEKSYYANCVWDALGVSAAFGSDADVISSDAYTGEPILLQVRGGSPLPQECVIHFAVPAAQWWDDIIYT